MFCKDLDDSTLYGIESDIENLRQYANVDMTSFKNELKDLLIEFLRSDVLVAIGGGIKPESGVMQFDHDLCDCSFS